jgi:hypothetical protein
MKTIASLNGVEFLRAINRTRHAAEKLMNVTGVLSIWKKRADFKSEKDPKDMTEEELKQFKKDMHEMERNQIKKNLNDILDTLLEKHPEETFECIMSLCVRDEGEPEPDGIELVMAAFNLISDKRVLDFLLQLGKSGLIVTEA